MGTCKLVSEGHTASIFRAENRYTSPSSRGNHVPILPFTSCFFYDAVTSNTVHQNGQAIDELEDTILDLCWRV